MADITEIQVGQEVFNIGGSGVDYSTTEQDTGLKWIDGKPLYRLVIKTTTPSNSDDTLIATLPNNFLVKNIYGSIKQGSYNYVPVMFVYGNEYVTTYYQFSPYNGIRMRSTYTATQNSPCEIVIEYTKTTD